MKSILLRFLAAISPMLLTGCLFKTATVPMRHFVLTPISTNQDTPVATEHISIAIGYVKMPSYLLKNSMAMRSGSNEVKYLDDALWAERLDHCFERALTANLSRLLCSESIYLSDWGRAQVQARVFIDVQQFDVDNQGHGKLIANWRINVPDSQTTLKSGQARLDCTGPSPRGHPEVIAARLSDLAAEFSRTLAKSLSESIALNR